MGFDPSWEQRIRDAGLIAEPVKEPAKEKKPDSPAEPKVRVSIRIEIEGLRLVSEANARGEWQKMRRKKEVRSLLGDVLGKITPPALPVVVKMIRLGGKRLDKHENLPMSFKSTKDEIADWLRVKDTGYDDRVDWEYDQEAAYTSGLRLEIRPK
jgi:hypothetical protein